MAALTPVPTIAEGSAATPALWNNLFAIINTNFALISSGTHTPGLTNVTNLDGTTAYVCQWFRVGTIVTVSGSVGVDPTAAGAARFEMSLPIAAPALTAIQLGGTATIGNVAAGLASISGQATNKTAQFDWIAADGSTKGFQFVFCYVIA